ncbi:hypothetical protein GXM_05615 [Nostoc sphaeroides CCNUC1]|uniref:Uncharacterized protein n=1 Tax=Nostoc sphaeroides CCNUC1 TaxID=2653204 RepID=A0A5P8W5V1_9NOSO|nr:hypothetical protein GXM_05615 [Nostoc sphaeroides CCNUC1]
MAIARQYEPSVAVLAGKAEKFTQEACSQAHFVGCNVKATHTVTEPTPPSLIYRLIQYANKQRFYN